MPISRVVLEALDRASATRKRLAEKPQGLMVCTTCEVNFPESLGERGCPNCEGEFRAVPVQTLIAALSPGMGGH